MMYSNKLAIAVKVNGKVLREFQDQVYVPFGAEYSLLIKNLNSVRVLVSVSIDGNDITDNSTQFVIDGNSSIELERFLKGNNKKKGNRFKFIERTSNIEKNRGIGVEDGLVRIEYQFERKDLYTVTKTVQTWDDFHQIYYTNWDSSAGKPRSFNSNNVNMSTTDTVNCSVDTNAYSSTKTVASKVLRNAPLNDAGITVEGSISDQKFETASWFPVEDTKHVMVLKLLGQTPDNIQVSSPVTVDVKPTCKTCGRKNKATAKFCSECGTSLQIVA